MEVLMTDAALAYRFDAGWKILHAAGKLALDYFHKRQELLIEKKGLQDLVSIADQAVERAIRGELARTFPADAIIGEEDGASDAHDEAPGVWVLDPIDGTSNFLRGMPYWCCVMAYSVNGVTEIGLTYDAVHDELFACRRGQGATRNGQSIKVSERPVEEACIGLSFNFKQDASSYTAMIDRMNAMGFDHRRSGSSALHLAHVADGRLDACITRDCQSWDVLAGLALVEEAGGIASRYTRGSTLLERRPVLAMAPQLQAAIEEAAGFTVDP
jgi:myo-inositol-1(or 4)-monophosphatase